MAAVPPSGAGVPPLSVFFNNIKKFPGYYINATKVHDIFFADNNNGLCSAATGIYNTTDGGNSLNNITALPDIGTHTSALFMSTSTNACVVYGNKVYHTNGSLSNWKMDTIVTTNTSLGLRSVFATSASVVYVSSYSGYLYKSTDGGITFTLLKKFDNVWNSSTWSDMHFINANTGFISVGSRIYKTTDAGNSWSQIVALGIPILLEFILSMPHMLGLVVKMVLF